MRTSEPSNAEAFLERDREVALLEEALAATRDGAGRVVVLEGEAGIGKTTLLDAASACGRRTGLRVLLARGGEHEREFGFGIVRQLFEDALLAAAADERLAVLEGPASRAAPLFGLGAGAPEADPGAVQHGLYRLALNLARCAPLLLVIDDVHWADLASLRWVLYLARRIERAPVCVLLARRPGELDAPEDLLRRLVAEPAVAKLELGPLSQGACERLAAGILPQPEPELCAVCYHQTAGNPFFLRELCHTLADKRLSSRQDLLDLARRLGPERLRDSVLVRLFRMPAASRELVRAVAVLETDAELRHAAALAGLEVEEASSAADQLAAARIFAPGTPLRFAHPILRAAVYRELSAAHRGALHRRAAELLAADGQLERGAVHLLVTSPQGDARVVALLRAAAGRALTHGAVETAASLLERALSEPPPPNQRAAVHLELGHAERLANRPEARAHLRAAFADATSPAQRARAAGELGAALMAWGGRPQEALELLLGAARELRPLDPARALEIEIDAASFAVLGGRWREREGNWLAELAERADPRTPAGRRLLGVLAYDCLATPGTAGREVAALLDRAQAHGSVWEDPPPWQYQSMVLIVVAFAEIALDRLEAAHQHVAQARQRAHALGSVPGEIGALAVLGRVEYLRGDLVDAEAHLRQACALIEKAGHWDYVDLPVSQLVLVLVERGQEEEARQLLRTHGLDAPELPRGHLTNQFLAQARIALWLAAGEASRARHDAEALKRMARRRRSPALLSGGGLMALGTFACGDVQRARLLAARQLAEARRFGVASAVGHALRTLGLIEGGERGLRHLAQSVEVLSPSPGRLEYTRALLDEGSALRRAGQRTRASAPLRQALDVAAAAGAERLAERARAELHLCGLRPRRAALSGLESLTEAELRVAKCAAQGHKNAEIARLLVVTLSTVETHLSAVYRKLGINGRGELPDALTGT
ncbi:MAG: helix-turn-helix transcriptional regulator [Pseudonocardiaceae bacterium]